MARGTLARSCIYGKLYLVGAIALLAALVIADESTTTDRDGRFGPPPVMVSLPASTPTAFIEDTPNTVLHWTADNWNIFKGASNPGFVAFGALTNITQALTTGPDGTLTAAVLTSTTNVSLARFEEAILAPGNYARTFSVYMKLGGQGTTASIGLRNDYASYACQSVTLTSSWQRVSVTTVANATTHTDPAIFVGANCGNGSVVGDQVVIWGPQLVRGPAPVPYKPPATTNLIAFSTAFDNARWLANGGGGPVAPVVTADQAMAPDGTLTADQIVFPAVSVSGQYSALRQDMTAPLSTTSNRLGVWLRTNSGTGLITLAVTSFSVPQGYVNCNVTTSWSYCQTALFSSAAGPSGLSALLMEHPQLYGVSYPAQTLYVWGMTLTRSDQNGDTFAMVSTVPFASTSPHFPRGYGSRRRFVGPMSVGNYFTTANTTDPFDLNGNFTVCVAFDATGVATTARLLQTGLETSSSGFGIYSVGAVGTAMAVRWPGAGNTITTGNNTVSGLNIYCLGRGGGVTTTGYVKLNAGATVSGTVVNSPDTSRATYIGAYDATTQPWQGRIYEIWASSTAWNETNVAAIEASAMANGGTGPLFLDDANTVFHAVGDAFDGTTWKTPQGSLTTVGTVGYSDAWVPPSSLSAPGYGPFSGTTYFTLGTGPDIIDFGGDFTICFVYYSGARGGNETIFSATDNGGSTGGYQFNLTSGTDRLQVYDGSGLIAQTAPANTNGFTVACHGRSGSNILSKVNLAATSTTALGRAVAPALSSITRMGLNLPATTPFSGVIYEVWASTDTPSDALYTKIQRRVLQQMTAQGMPLNVTRTTTTSYELLASSGQTLFYYPAGVTPATPDGYQIFRQSTNLALQSEALENGAYIDVGAPTVTANQYVAPDGQTTMDKIVNGSGEARRQNATSASSTGPFTSSAWVRADSGTSPMTVAGQCPGGNSVVTCSCVRSDNVACSAAVYSAVACVAAPTVGTTPVRIATTFTCTSATTAPQILVSAGQFGVSGGTGGAWGMQVETGSTPTPYIPTTAASVQRNADTLTVQNPIQPQDTRWCVQGTYTPVTGRAWYDAEGTSHSLWAMTPLNYDSPNSARLEIIGPKLSFVLNDSAGVQSRLDYTGAIAVGRHDTKACVADGRLALYLDGALVSAGKATNTGDWRALKPGAWSVSPSTVTIGSRVNGTSYWDGWVRDFAVVRDPLSQADLAAIDGLIAASMDWSASGPLIDDDANTVIHWTSTGNLLRFPNNISVSPWATTNLTVTGGQVAPDNSTTAFLVTKNTAAELQTTQNLNLNSGTYTASFYVKAGTATAAGFTMYNGTDGFAPCVSRIVSGPGGASGVAVITVNGLSTTQWTRVTVVCSLASTRLWSFVIYPEGKSATTNGASNYLWGLMLVRGDKAGTYSPPPGNGDTFVMTGTVPVTDSPFFQNGAGVRRAIGPFTDSDYLTNATAAPISGSADKTVCVAFDYPVGTTPAYQTLVADGGMVLQVANGASTFVLQHAGASQVASGNTLVQGAMNVACAGTTGSATTKYVRLNQGATVSNGAAAVTATGLWVGRHSSTTYAWPGRIYEVWMTTTAWDENIVTQQISRALGQGDGSKSLFLPDANTVVHLKGNDFSGGALWAGDYPYVLTKTGAPAFADIFPPPISGSRGRIGFGPSSTGTNYFGLSSGNDVLDFTGDYSACFVFVYGASGVQQVYENGNSNSRLQANSVSTWNTMCGGALNSGLPSGTAALLSPNVVCIGRSGTSYVSKLNLSATTVGAAGTCPAVADTANAARIGAGGSGAVTGSMLEAWFSTTTPTDALFTKIAQKVFGHLSASGAVIANSRSTPAAYDVPRGTDVTQALFTAPANVTPTGPYGRGSWGQRVNYALQSQDVTTTWGLVATATRTADQYVAPDGTTTMDKVVAAANSDAVSQTVTVPSGSTFTASSWVRANAATEVESLVLSVGSAPTACTCARGDGQACTATAVANTCVAYSTFSTTPVRFWLSTTATSATTAPIMYLAPGQYGTSTGTAGYWGMQVEAGAYPTPYIATTTASVQRNADVETMTITPPATTDPWCLDAYVTPSTSNLSGSALVPVETRVFLSAGSYQAANSTTLDAPSSGNIRFVVYDGSGTSKSVAVASVSNGPHRLTGCGQGGALTLYVDGVSVGSITGGGAGTLGTWPTTLSIGGDGGSGRPANGFTRGARVCKGTPQQCLALPL